MYSRFKCMYVVLMVVGLTHLDNPETSRSGGRCASLAVVCLLGRVGELVSGPGGRLRGTNIDCCVSCVRGHHGSLFRHRPCLWALLWDGDGSPSRHSPSRCCGECLLVYSQFLLDNGHIALPVSSAIVWTLGILVEIPIVVARFEFSLDVALQYRTLLSRFDGCLPDAVHPCGDDALSIAIIIEGN